MIALAILQLAIPAILIAWLARYPAGNRFLLALQIAVVGLLLLALPVLGMWILPVWWAPWVFLAIWLMIAVIRLPSFRLPGKGSGIAMPVTLVVLAAAAAYTTMLTTTALNGRGYDPQYSVDIASPLTSGTYIVAQGGSNRTINEHHATLDDRILRYAAWRGQSRGLDIVRIDAVGMRTNGLLPEDPARYRSYGTLVISPCKGRVEAARDGLPDMRVPEMDTDRRLGNYAIINCGEFYVVVAHLKNGSLEVREGQEIDTSAPLGEIGNSGASAEPHLHIHAQRNLPDENPISGEPLDLTINGRFHFRNDRIVVE